MDDQIIEREFVGYVTATYGKILPGSDQWEHLRGAFFGGALIALNRSDLYEDAVSMQRELDEFPKHAPIANRPIGRKAS